MRSETAYISTIGKELSIVREKIEFLGTGQDQSIGQNFTKSRMGDQFCQPTLGPAKFFNIKVAN